jgi:hypothetical protein
MVTVNDFTLTSSSSGSSSLTVLPGGTASFALVFAPSGTTFTGAVTLSVTGLPSGATATITPTTIPAGSSTTNLNLMIAVPKTMAALQSNDHLAKLAPVALSLPMGMLFLPFVGNLRRFAGKKKGLLVRVLFLGLLAAALFGLAGCGSSGSGSSPGVQSHTYPVTVTGTSGSVSHSTTVNLTVK